MRGAPLALSAGMSRRQRSSRIRPVPGGRACAFTRGLVFRRMDPVSQPTPPVIVLALPGAIILAALSALPMIRGRLTGDDAGIHFTTFFGRAMASWPDLLGVEVRGSNLWKPRLVILTANQRPRCAAFYDPAFITSERAEHIVASILGAGRHPPVARRSSRSPSASRPT